VWRASAIGLLPNLMLCPHRFPPASVTIGTAYMSRFWRPKAAGEWIDIAAALLGWPAGVAVCASWYTIRNGAVVVTGLIDFGNALAADAIFDLAKAIFCTEHMVSGAGALLLEGYGVIDYPEPQRALWLYTLLHRVSMWAWLRHIGVIARGQHDALIDDLEAMLAERGL
jgi:hypothetical protein